jgi:hypothetical protein
MGQVSDGGSGEKSLRNSYGKKKRQDMQTKKQRRPPRCCGVGEFCPPRFDEAA